MPQTRRQRITSSQRSEREHSPLQVPDPDPDPAPSHGYGTQRSMQLARPAYALGLHKRTQAEIHAEAEKKRAAKEEKKQAVARKAQRRAEGAKELARLEDERILADADKDRYLAQSLAELQASDNTYDLPDGDAPPPHEPDLPMDWELEDEPPEKMPPLMEVDDSGDEGAESDGSEAQARRCAIREGKKRATSADLDSHADHHRGPLPSRQSDSDSSSEDGMAEILAELKRQENMRTKPGESSKQVDNEDDEDEEQDIPRHSRTCHHHLPAPAWFSSDDDWAHEQERGTKRLRTRRDTNDDGDQMDVDYPDGGEGQGQGEDEDEGYMQTPLNAAERRMIKRTAVRSQIEAHRTQPSPATVRQHASAARSTQAHPSMAHQGRNVNMFTAAFRNGRYQGPQVEPLPDPSPPHPVPKPTPVPRSASASMRPGSTSQPSGSRIAGRTRTPSSHGHASSSRVASSSGPIQNKWRMMEPDGSDVERDAFHDEDVMFSREYAMRMSGQRGKNMVSARCIPTEEAQALGFQSSQKKRKRKHRSPVPEDKSRSAANVPDFVKPVLFTELISTILEYFSAKADPWNTREHGPDELLNLSQELLNDLCPRAEYRLSKSDVIYKVIQQEVYEWRSRFASAAISAVDDAICEKFGPNPRRADVQAWIRDATAPGGESLWARPHRNPDRAQGSLQSCFVLRSFATHLHATNGSIYLYGPPVGALSLAATAVQHVFPMYKTRRFIPGRAFSSANVGYLTESWYRKSVCRYARREDKFAKLVWKASRFSMSYYQTKARNGGETLQAPDVFDRSSPPLEDTDDEGDGDEYDGDNGDYYHD